jgi:hypothetical protein
MKTKSTSTNVSSIGTATDVSTDVSSIGTTTDASTDVSSIGTETTSDVSTDVSSIGTETTSDASTDLSSNDVEEDARKTIDIAGVPEMKVENLGQVFVEQAPISQEETNKIKDELKCIDGQQFDVNTNRCLPCTEYNLVWDPIYKMCKISLTLPSKDVIIVNEKDDIIGYM